MIKALEFPITSSPEFGTALEVAEGVYWIRMPLPWPPTTINLWLLKDGDGWVIVDTGLATDEVINHWRSICEHVLQGANVNKVIVTHLHPDHVGLAGWLTHKLNADLYMSRTEYLHCRVLLSDSHKNVPDEAMSHYKRTGFDEEALDMYRSQFGGFGRLSRAAPDAYQRLQAGQALSIDGYEWHVIIGEGHSPEHVCLFCPDKNIFISGDQLLPNISSNVSVWPLEPNANPLKGWLDSCAMLKLRLSEDVLVLPSHGKLFRGAHVRLSKLIEDHESSLEKLYHHCSSPRRVVDTFEVLFRRPISHRNLILATGEALAHLNYLLFENRLVVEQDSDGVNYYRQLP